MTVRDTGVQQRLWRLGEGSLVVSTSNPHSCLRTAKCRARKGKEGAGVRVGVGWCWETMALILKLGINPRFLNDKRKIYLSG